MANNQPDPARIDTRGSALRVPRSRGALSGLLLLLLGVWGALIPFIGPLFSFAFTPDSAWTWTAARGWLEVLPGAAAALGGLILMVSANRVTAGFGAWLAVAGGAWFVIGMQLAGPLHIGSAGSPVSTNSWLRALESLAFFYGLGTLIVFLAAGALGRLSVRSVRDVKLARRREAAAAEARAAEDRAAAARVRAAERDRERAAQRAGQSGNRDGGPSAETANRRTTENAQNDHAHRHFGFRRAARDDAQAGDNQQAGYQPGHLDERSPGASSVER